MRHPAHGDDVLFVTLDSARYDAFCEAATPNLKGLGKVHRAWSPSHFTFGAHAAFFVGFTPGDPTRREPYINPKFGRIFRLDAAGAPGFAPPRFLLQGENIVAGFRAAGYRAFGTGAVRWFDPETPAGRVLSRPFHEFLYLPEPDVRAQCRWLMERVAGARREGSKVFAFLNAGETHVPYWHPEADWDKSYNPAQAFGEANDAAEARRRQVACLEWVDRHIGELLRAFEGANIVVCADHGDCWGEDGLWEHGISHRCTLEVPLIFSLSPGEEA
ncbi:MAG: sulfatase-like hydrolase/transferase [Thermoanaerobaculum sp.]